MLWDPPFSRLLKRRSSHWTWSRYLNQLSFYLHSIENDGCLNFRDFSSIVFELFNFYEIQQNGQIIKVGFKSYSSTFDWIHHGCCPAWMDAMEVCRASSMQNPSSFNFVVYTPGSLKHIPTWRLTSPRMFWIVT